MVLDGGSYDLVLFFHGGAEPLELFVPNPTRRRTRRIDVRILRHREGKTTFADLGSSTETPLVRQLRIAAADPGLSGNKQAACLMLLKIFENPETPWEEVHFPTLLEAMIEEQTPP